MKKKVLKGIVIITSMIIVDVVISSYGGDALVSNYVNNSKYNYELLNNSKVESKKNYTFLDIPKINIHNNVVKALDNFSNLDKNLVYYRNLNPKNKIIVFGHSGMGYGTYFNRLERLNISDKAFLHIENNIYTYIVKRKYLVDKKDVFILDDEVNSRKLLLVTCDKNNKNKRLVVELMLKY